MVKSRSTALCTLIFSLLALSITTTPDVFAKERVWCKYENQYFEAYSDASEKKVRGLLEELENFRAAVIQLNGGSVPDGAVKTQVIIFNSRKQLREIVNRNTIDAYATVIRGVPHIVMSVGGFSEWSRITIRHEFTHVLQAYSEARSPPWYVEGFAEFMSGMKFRDQNTEFIIGDFAGRSKADTPFMDWDELISDEFNFHQISSGAKASNAYLQSWLLVHFLTLGDKLAHNKDLIEYLTLYSRGDESTAAFLKVFGESANEMGPRIYKQYSRRFYPMMLKFLPGSQDQNFVRTTAPTEFVADIVNDLRAIEWAQRDQVSQPFWRQQNTLNS